MIKGKGGGAAAPATPVAPAPLLVCLMEKPNPSGERPEVKEAHFSNKTTMKLSDYNTNKMYNDASKRILESMTKYQKEGSSWRLKRVLELEIHVVEYNPVGGSSYILLPERLRGKKAIST